MKRIGYILFGMFIMALLLVGSTLADAGITLDDLYPTCQPGYIVPYQRPTPALPTISPTPVVGDTLPFNFGIAYPTHCEDVRMAGADWFYNANFTPWDCPGLNAMSLVRDLDQANDLMSGTAQIPADAIVIAGVNEPDICPDQGCATPAEWVPVHLWLEDNFPKTPLMSPAPSPNDPYWLWINSSARQGFIWKYESVVPDTWPRLDYLAAHIYLYRYYGSGGAIDNLRQSVGIIREFLVWQDITKAKGICITEFAAIAMRTNSGEFDYNSAIAILNEFWYWPEGQNQGDIEAWYNEFDKPLGEMIACVAWYTAHDDPVWGFGPNRTTAIFEGDRYDPNQRSTPFLAWVQENLVRHDGLHVVR